MRGNIQIILKERSVTFLSVKFCFTAQDHVITVQPNSNDSTVIIVSPSGEAISSSGEVYSQQFSWFAALCCLAHMPNVEAPLKRFLADLGMGIGT